MSQELTFRQRRVKTAFEANKLPSPGDEEHPLKLLMKLEGEPDFIKDKIAAKVTVWWPYEGTRPVKLYTGTLSLWESSWGDFISYIDAFDYDHVVGVEVVVNPYSKAGMPKLTSYQYWKAQACLERWDALESPPPITEEAGGAPEPVSAHYSSDTSAPPPAAPPSDPTLSMRQAHERTLRRDTMPSAAADPCVPHVSPKQQPCGHPMLDRIELPSMHACDWVCTICGHLYEEAGE
jgi:hypothetical protein